MRFFQRYRWLLPSLAFTLLLVALRAVVTGNTTVLFLYWNLFLAMLPLWFAHRLRACYRKKGARVWIWAALWLLFFPNSMYITTDLFHLKPRADVPLWYDLLVLLSAAINGVLYGFLSMIDAEAWLRQQVRKGWVQPIVAVLMMACGFGIYLGRYLRFNSWDIVGQPFSLMSSIYALVRHPFRNLETWLLTLAFGSWLYLLYTAFRKRWKPTEPLGLRRNGEVQI